MPIIADVRPVNLLPDEQRPTVVSAPADRPVGAYAVLAALALAVVAVALSVLAASGIEDRRAELASVTSQATVVEQQAGALRGYADFAKLAESRVETVRGLARSRFAWDRTLADLTRALPANVHLSELVGSTSADAGGGENPLRSAVSAPALELNGCAPSQRSVAVLMARLRAVRGVTRVSLAKSADDEAGTQGAAASGADPKHTSSVLCPASRAPHFEVVVFFEHSSVPQAATVNDPAAATPAAAAGAAASATPSATPSASGSPTPGATPATTSGTTTAAATTGATP